MAAPPLLSPGELLLGALIATVLVVWRRPVRTPGTLGDLGASAVWASPLALLAGAAVAVLDAAGLERAGLLPWDLGLVPRSLGTVVGSLLAGALTVWAWRARRASREAEAACDPYPALRGRASLP